MSIKKLPVTRYYGSKRKLINQIWEVFDNLNLEFDSTLDVFGGSGIFSYYAKLKKKKVLYNDIFKFNYFIGKALIENKRLDLTKDEVLCLLEKSDFKIYKNSIEANFKDIYFTDVENKQIDIIVQNINDIESEQKKASAFYLLFQSCIIKRPYNLFHRKNLNLRINYSGGNFGNKVTWERSFNELFLKFHKELNEFTFDNFRENIVLNSSALKCEATADLIYIDPPYFGIKSHVSYHKKYHFLEGLTCYNCIEDFIDTSKKHSEITINRTTEFDRRDFFLEDMNKLIDNHRHSIIVVSYRSNGFPSIDAIANLISRHKSKVSVVDLGNYNYALNRNNSNNFEYLVIGS